MFKRSNLTYKKFNTTLVSNKGDDPCTGLDDNWIYTDQLSDSRSVNRAKHALFLLQALRGELKDNQSHDVEKKISSEDQKLYIGAISAFVTFLAFFRRPRTIPILHSIIERWAFRMIGDNDKITEEEAEKTHLAVIELLGFISASNVESKNEKHELFPGIDQKSLPIVAQQHEGGNFWLFREVHESTYEALTECLHTQEWIEQWSNNVTQCPNGITKSSAVIDAMVFISWHLLAARTYYVDVFMPTRDIKAFYEYLYHRVTAIRTITLTIAILAVIQEKTGSDWDILCNKLLKLNQHSTTLEVGNAVFWYAEVIGLFSQISISDSKTCDIANFITLLKNLRQNSLDTLFSALQRNRSLFLALSIPDTIQAWAEQFIKRDLPEMSGEKLFDEKNKMYKIVEDQDSEETIKKLEHFFLDIKASALMSKFDYESVLDNKSSETNFIASFINELNGVVKKQKKGNRCQVLSFASKVLLFDLWQDQ